MHTACADGVARVFKLDDASSKSFKYESQTLLRLSSYHLNVNDANGVPHFFFLILCRFLRINLPAGGHPTAISFVDDASSLVVATYSLSGSSLYMYGEEKPKASGDTKQQSKLPLPEIKWGNHKVHDTRAILTLAATKATYGSADGSTIIASCSEGSFRLYIHCICIFRLLDVIL